MPKRPRLIAFTLGAAGIAVLLANIVLAAFRADSFLLAFVGYVLLFAGLGIARFWRYRPPHE